MGLTLKALSEIAHAQLRGDPDRVVDRVATLQHATEGALSFLANPHYRSFLKATKASAVILSAEDAPDCPVDCLVSDNPYLSHARAMNALYPVAGAMPGVHPTAHLDPTAQVASDVEIGANCYLGSGVVVEAGAVVGPGCVLLDNVVIGTDSRLVAAVTLCPETRLGKRCLIHPGAVIGADGFGPSELSVPRGSIVKWVNTDIHDHTTTSTSPSLAGPGAPGSGGFSGGGGYADDSGFVGDDPF